MLSKENKAKLYEKSAQLVKILLELREIAPVKFHDTDCDNCVFNFLGVNYDEDNGEIHIDMAMWEDALENIAHSSPYTIVETAGIGHIFLIRGNYQGVEINSPHEVHHYNLKRSSVVAYADRREKTINWPLPNSYNPRTIAYAIKMEGLKADSDEEAVKQFKQIVEERWF